MPRGCAATSLISLRKRGAEFPPYMDTDIAQEYADCLAKAGL